MNKKTFSPLAWLAALGAGGIAVMPFAFMQYTVSHGPGLVKLSDIGQSSLPMLQQTLFYSLESVMIVFSLIHFVLSIIFFSKWLKWMKTETYKEIKTNPLTNATLMTPFISFTMTMNVFIGPVRFFIPSFAENLQSFMLPALIAWLALWMTIMYFEISLLTTSFKKGFDINKINFGWLLHPFALGMLSVVGMGIAALSKDLNIASTAAFLALISGTMGAFLLLVKMIALFKSHFAANGLPDKQFLPSFLIVLPNVTLYAISAFRFGHYLEHALSIEMGAYFALVITLPFAFEVWYLVFGLVLLRNYFREHFFNSEFHVSQWGLICPIVAFGVLGSFAYKVFAASPVIYAIILLSVVTAVTGYLILLSRHATCAELLKKTNYNCG